MADKREYDLILWGATGFTGQLAAAYMARHAEASEVRWALAGRNHDKLAAVRDELARETPAAADVPLLTADATDAASMATLAARSRVVCSTVGPFALHGSALVAACADNGTHYCDITGESHWIRAMMDAHHARAVETGARIVHSCGFDSIPSDLGAWMLQNCAQENFGRGCERIDCRIRAEAPGLSGGTVGSMLTIMDLLATDPSLRKHLGNPYSLNPEGCRGPAVPRDSPLPAHDADAHTWTAPFMMAMINTRVVRRSNALLQETFGSLPVYTERTDSGPGAAGLKRAAMMSAGMAVFGGLMLIAPVRRLLAKHVLPKPGEGPSKEARAKSWFEATLVGHGPSDNAFKLEASFFGPGDPGYDETAKMVIESALCLARDTDRLSPLTGSLTPSAAMAAPLIERLRAAGQRLDVSVVSQPQNARPAPRALAAHELN